MGYLGVAREHCPAWSVLLAEFNPTTWLVSWLHCVMGFWYLPPVPVQTCSLVANIFKHWRSPSLSSDLSYLFLYARRNPEGSPVSLELGEWSESGVGGAVS